MALVVFSPWISIPYSDSTGLLFPTTTLLIYIELQKTTSNRYWISFFFGLMLYVSYKIKPQLLIVFLAIMIYELIYIIIIREKRVNGRRILAITMGMVLSVLLVNTCISSLNIKIDDSKRIGVAHFLMMGLNQDSSGSYAREDAVFSSGIPDKKTRDAADLARAAARIKQMGASGYIRHAGKKMLVNYNDGTFCWGGEGEFYKTILPAKGKVSYITRNIYYNQDYRGRWYGLWSNIIQMIWVAVIGLCIPAALSKNKKPYVGIMMLSIIGLTLFELLFEARARYLFAYTPFYIILASVGARYLLGLFYNKSAHVK